MAASAAAAADVALVKKEGHEITVLLNGASTLALVLGVASTAAGALALEYSGKLKNLQGGEAHWSSSDRSKVIAAATITAIGVLSLLLTLFWMFRGHKWLKDVWKRRTAKSSAGKAPALPSF